MARASVSRMVLSLGLIWVGTSVPHALAAVRPAPKHVVKPYSCKQWSYSFFVPHGWSSKNVKKQLDRCSGKNGASAVFFSPDKRAYVSVTLSKQVEAAGMPVRILRAAGAQPADMRFSDRIIDGVAFHIGTVAVPLRGDGADYFFLTGCAERADLAYCLTGAIVRSDNYRFVGEEHSLESALLSFHFLPPPPTK
jgi:hypothetical protein